MRAAIDRMPSGGNHCRRGRRRGYHESGGFGLDSDSATALHRTGTIRSRRRERCSNGFRSMWLYTRPSGSAPIVRKCRNDASISDSRQRCHLRVEDGPAGCLGQRLPIRISICDTIRAVIHSFRCKDMERLAAGYRVRRFAAIERVAQRKLAQLDAAATLDFLRVPPGNRLEALKGDLTGFHPTRRTG